VRRPAQELDGDDADLHLAGHGSLPAPADALSRLSGCGSDRHLLAPRRTRGRGRRAGSCAAGTGSCGAPRARSRGRSASSTRTPPGARSPAATREPRPGRPARRIGGRRPGPARPGAWPRPRAAPWPQPRRASTRARPSRARSPSRVAAADVAVDPREPDLLQVLRAPGAARVVGQPPEVGAEEGAPLVDRDRVAADLDIRVVGHVGQLQRVLHPAHRAHRVPDADEPGRAVRPGHGLLELPREGEVRVAVRGPARSGPSACGSRRGRAPRSRAG
jgi:hypothetical protein